VFEHTPLVVLLPEWWAHRRRRAVERNARRREDPAVLAYRPAHSPPTFTDR